MSDKSKPWLNMWPVDVPVNIKYPAGGIHEILQETAKKFPEKTAIIFSEKEITYAELDLCSNGFAHSLIELGVGKGDKVAIYLPNVPEFIIAFFGTLKAGAVVTAISPLYREREVEYQLNNSEAVAIVTMDALYPIVERVREKNQLKHVIVTGLSENQAALNQKTLPFQQMVGNTKTEPPQITINPDEDLAALQFTGGTTGTSKGAMLTHENLVSNALQFAAWIKGKPAQETFLTALPLFHIYGMTTSMTVPISLAAKMVLLPKFDPVKALESLQKHKVTVFCGVPTMYAILLANPELSKFNLTSIRVCISGASPLPPQVQKNFMQITGGLLAEGYGLTEASPVTHCNPVDPTMRTVRLGSIGLPLSDTEAKIVDLVSGEKTLDPGEIGELAVKGPQVMKGYWRNPKETALVMRNGWLLTGDIAKMDKDGYFYITDRKKDLIKYKDYSVYPREIEDVLYEHPAVKLCAVIGKPDKTVGEIPKAFIVAKEGKTVTAEEILNFVKEKVAPYKIIREVEFRAELPISSAGKVLRRVLQEEEKKKNS